MAKALPEEPEIIIPWRKMTIGQKNAAMTTIGRIRRTQGIEAAQRAWIRSGMVMTPAMFGDTIKRV